MNPDDLSVIMGNLKEKFSHLFDGPKLFAPGLRRSETVKSPWASKHGRPYTKPPLHTKALKAKKKTRRLMAKASRKINRKH